MPSLSRILAATAVAASIVLPATAASATVATPGNVVIAGAYGGGGNSGPTAAFQYDFVQLFNRGTTAQSLSGDSLQYLAPSSGTSNWIINLPNVILQPGQSFLFEGYNSNQATATNSMPTADLASNSSANDIKRDSWTIDLVTKTTAVTGDTDPAIEDQLGVGPSLGTTPKYAAGSPAPAVSNTAAALRNGGGCTDTDNNAADFTIVTPTAANPYPFRNLSSPAVPCSGPTPATPEVSDVVLLPVGAAALIGGGVILTGRRRRRSANR